MRALKQEAGLGIWLCGGAELAATLFPEIDELILKVNPILLGAGIPLFSGRVEPSRLRVVDHKAFGNGVTITRYRMQR